MLAFKYVSLAHEWQLVHPVLGSIITWVIQNDLWGPYMVLTSIYRDHARQQRANPGMLGRSPHGTYPIERWVRAVDVRTRDVPEHVVGNAASRINAAWDYDPERQRFKVAVLESDHLHLQVHENTKFML